MTQLVVPCTAETTMTAAGPLEHICPYVDEVDQGHVTIAWKTKGETFELHALAEYLSGWRDMEVSHESVTLLIRDHLNIYEGIEVISVVTTWETAGLEVRCFTSPTRVGTL